MRFCTLRFGEDDQIPGFYFYKNDKNISSSIQATGYSFEKKIIPDKYSYYNNRGTCASTINISNINEFTVYTKFICTQVDGYYWAFIISTGSNLRQVFISDDERGCRFTVVGDDGRSRLYDSGMQIFNSVHDFLVIKQNNIFYLYLDGVLKYQNSLIESNDLFVNFNPQPINGRYYGRVYFNELTVIDKILGPEYRSDTDYFARELIDPKRIFCNQDTYGK